VQRCKRGDIFRPQVSGTGVQVQVRVPGKVQILNLYPNPNT